MKINLSVNQMKKIDANAKKGLGSKIRVEPNQIGSGKKYPLTTKQIEDLKIGKKNGKSVPLNFPINQLKTGGFLPLLALGIGAAASAIGGVATIANAYFDKKDKDLIRAETERYHNELLKIMVKNGTSVSVGSNLNKKKPKKKVHFKNTWKNY